MGYLKQLTVDDKGFVAVIGFGVPPHAHDNDPVRGLQCAMVGSNCVNMRTFNLRPLHSFDLSFKSHHFYRAQFTSVFLGLLATLPCGA